MHRRTSLILVGLALVLAAGGSAAYAQEGIVAEVPFAFTAGSTTHPAGSYELRINDDQVGVTLIPAKGAPNAMLAITRLGLPAKDKNLPDGRLVFDEIGGKYILAEAWLPGEDGFLLYTTKEKHAHHFISLHRKARK